MHEEQRPTQETQDSTKVLDRNFYLSKIVFKVQDLRFSAFPEVANGFISISIEKAFSALSTHLYPNDSIHRMFYMYLIEPARRTSFHATTAFHTFQMLSKCSSMQLSQQGMTVQVDNTCTFIAAFQLYLIHREISSWIYICPRQVILPSCNPYVGQENRRR